MLIPKFSDRCTVAFTALACAAGAAVAPGLAVAKPAYLGSLRSAFSGAPLPQQCQVCHSNRIPQLNLFGRDFHSLKARHGVSRMDLVWADLRDLDSNGDGSSNEEDMMAGRNPGAPRAAGPHPALQPPPSTLFDGVVQDPAVDPWEGDFSP